MLDTNRTSAAIQSFALFVALSVVFGRMFVLSYHKALGVPVPDIQPNPLEYSIVSPDVAILSVGLALIVVFQYIWSPPNADAFDWNRFIVGSAMLIMYILMASLDFISRPAWDPSLSNPGMWGLWNLARLLMLILGIKTIVSSTPRQTYQRWAWGPSNTETQTERERRSFLGIYPLVVILFIGVMFLNACIFVWGTGEREADRRLQNAPLARVEADLTPANLTTFGYDFGQHVDQQSTGVFKVVSIDEKFVYLLPSNADSWEQTPPILILPTTGIKSIRYMSDGGPPPDEEP